VALRGLMVGESAPGPAKKPPPGPEPLPHKPQLPQIGQQAQPCEPVSMKKLLTLLITLALCLTVQAQTRTLIGTFQSLEFGDYAHVQIADQKGEVHSFWLGNDHSLMKFVDNPQQYEGKPVKVHWHTVKRNIPEAGGEMEIEEATRIEVLNQ